MDKKTLLIIFSVTSILIIGGYIYNGFNKLNKKIDLLEKELTTLKLENTCQLPKKINVGNQNKMDEELSKKNFSSSISNDTDIIKTDREKVIVSNYQYKNTSEVNKSIDSDSTTTSESLTTTRNEVIDLENQLKNVQEMIDNNEVENGTLNYEELDRNTTGRIDTILNDSDEYNNMLNGNKNNSSEFDDLENVPENNSELNELIKQESMVDNNEELFSVNVAENISESNMQSLEELKSNSLISEDKNIIENGSASFKEVNDQMSDKQDIEISVIEKRFNVKQLKNICQSNNLPMSGNKKTLIERIINNNLGNELENFNKPKLTENLTK